MRAFIWRNFLFSVCVWIVWWASLYARTGDIVYLLLVLVQMLAWVVAYRRVPVIGRLIAGILGGMLLFIFGALAFMSLQRGRPVSCLDPLTALLLLYIGPSHLAYAAIGGGPSGRLKP